MTEQLFLMDTNIVSLMGRTLPPPGLRQWLLDVGVRRLALSYPVIAELLRGAHLLERQNPRKSEEIKAWVGRVLATDFPFLDMTTEVAFIYARMTAVPELRHMWTVQRHQKQNRLGHDLMIAAVAIAHKVPILTDNVADFLTIQRIFKLPGLYHPLTSQWHVPALYEARLPVLRLAHPEPSEQALPRLDGDRDSGAPGVTSAP